jgi:protein-S-isoprenylcysteine O-methyltransferase Ste14/rhodanese-related sulfurtransferase
LPYPMTTKFHVFQEWLEESRLVPVIFYLASLAVVFVTAWDTGFSRHELSSLEFIIVLLLSITGGFLLLASLAGLITYFIFLPSIAQDGHLFSRVHGNNLIHPLNTSIVLGLAALCVFTGSKAGGAIWVGLLAIHVFHTFLIMGRVRREQLGNDPNISRSERFLLLLSLILGTKVVTVAGGAKSLPPWRLDELPEHTWIVDVRTRSEFQWNRLQGAENYPWGAGVMEAAKGKPKERPVLVTCFSGHRSPSVAVMLRKFGFKTVYNLNWGLLYLVLLERGKRREGPFALTRLQGDPVKCDEKLKGMSVAYITLQVLIFFMAPLENFVRGVHVSGMQQAVGGGITLIGLILAVLSFRALGKNFRVYAAPRPNGTLVVSGIYSKMRHPMYTAAMAIFGGWILIFGSLWSVPLWLAFSILYLVKSAKEERILIDRFPEYAEYRKKTWSFLPYIY